MTFNKMQTKSKCDFNKCCYFIDLKTGCLLIGYFYLIELLISSILMGIRKADNIATIEADEKLRHLLPLTIMITTIICICFVLSFAFIIILLIGLHKNKPEYVKAYLIFKIIFLVIYVSLTISTIFEGRSGPVTILVRVVQLATSIYFLLVIRSYHMNVMKRPSHENV